MAANIRFINPDTLSKPPTYTQVVEVTGPGRTVYVSGQLASGRDGKLVGGDFRAQAVQVYENLKAALAAVGATFKDVVKINSYLADIRDLPVLRDVRAGYLNAAALPASTTLGSLSFAREGALLEVEVIAVLPAEGRAAQGQIQTRRHPQGQGQRTTKRKVISSKPRRQDQRRPQHVAEEARHPDAALGRDRIDHEVRRVADIGERAHVDRAHRNGGERRARAAPSASRRRRRQARRTRDRSAHCRGTPTEVR